MATTDFNVVFKHPFNAIVSGPTGCGKTHWVLKLLESSLINKKPQKIFWFYGVFQQLYDDLANRDQRVTLHKGLPNVSFQEFLKNNDATGQDVVFVFDDLMQTAANDGRITELFVQLSHHMNISVILIVQNLYYKGSQMRTLSLNAHYMVLFKNVRDKTQIRTLATQMYPSKPAVLMDAYLDATKASYGYLLVNMQTDAPEDLRLATDVFSRHVLIYVPAVRV